MCAVVPTQLVSLLFCPGGESAARANVAGLLRRRDAMSNIRKSRIGRSVVKGI